MRNNGFNRTELEALVPGYVVNDPEAERRQRRQAQMQAAAALGQAGIDYAGSALTLGGVRLRRMMSAVSAWLRVVKVPKPALPRIGWPALSELSRALAMLGRLIPRPTPFNLALLAAVALGGLAVIGETPPDEAQRAVSSVPAAPIAQRPPDSGYPLTGWQENRRPIELIALEAPELRRVKAVYRSRSHASGRREESLNWTDPRDGNVVHVALQLGTKGEDSPLFVDLARRAAVHSLSVVRMAPPQPLLTKFGDIEVADLALSSVDGQEIPCLGFRRRAGDDSPRLAGWYCLAKPMVERPALACFIDRLALMSAGEDLALRKFFTDAEKRRATCPTSRVSTGRRATWLDVDGEAPMIRGHAPAHTRSHTAALMETGKEKRP
jgi:hypothetical protein